MSKRSKRVSLAGQQAAPPESPSAEGEAATPQPQATPGTDVPAQPLQVPLPEAGEAPVPVAGGETSGVARMAVEPAAPQKPGIEVQPLFWFVMGSLTVGIMVLAGLLMMNPTPAVAKPKTVAPTAALARAATATPVAQTTLAAEASQPDIGATVTAAFEANQSVPRITVTETKQLLDAGQILFVDVRSKDLYDQQHAKGAINIPQSDTVARLSELPKDKDIVLYCS